MPLRSPISTHEEQPARARLFFALCPDEPTRDALYKASHNVARNSGGRPMAPEHFHITLAFLGGVPPELEERVSHRAAGTAGAVQADPFSFELDEIGYWPNSKVIWYGCSHTPSPLHSFAMGLRRSLQGAGLPTAPGKFVPHVTLARWVKDAGPLPQAERIRWDVSEFVLIRSETLSSGVHYTRLASCPLGRQGLLI